MHVQQDWITGSTEYTWNCNNNDISHTTPGQRSSGTLCKGPQHKCIGGQDTGSNGRARVGHIQKSSSATCGTAGSWIKKMLSIVGASKIGLATRTMLCLHVSVWQGTVSESVAEYSPISVSRSVCCSDGVSRGNRELIREAEADHAV